MRQLILYGDVHGCYEQLVKLFYIMKALYPKAEHWHLGDLVDRGPESGLSVQFVMENFDGGILGNHEETILKQWKSFKRDGHLSRNPDKARTVSQLNDERVKYLKSLPRIHVFDDLNLVIAHGGIYPKVPLYKQSAMPNTCRLQMIPKAELLMTTSGRWWGAQASHQPKIGKSEEENVADGYERWYKLYDHKENCIYGHSVMGLHPHIHQNDGYGMTIGIDTGSCFGGYLTAFVYPDMKYVREKCPEYTHGKNVSQMRVEENR